MVKSYSPAKVLRTERLPSPSTATWNGSASSPTKAPSGVNFRHGRKFGRGFWVGWRSWNFFHARMRQTDGTWAPGFGELMRS
jgi:hypothetical protein